MTWEIFSEFVQEVATQVTAWGIVVGAVWKISKQYRERQKKRELEQQKAILEKIEEAFSPHTEKLERTKHRLDVIEEKTYDHEGRLVILEKENGIRDVKWVEQYNKERD